MPHRHMALTDRELWACAQQVIKMHGEDAPMEAAHRLMDLLAASDHEGVTTWEGILERIEQLIDPRTGKPLELQ